MEFLDDDTAVQLLRHPELKASLLLFILSDPKIIDRDFADLDKYDAKFHQMYKQFMVNKHEYVEGIRNESEGFRSIFEEDIMYLTKEYHDVYKTDSHETCTLSPILVEDLTEMMLFLRGQFKDLNFDFHACFYYDAAKKVYKEGLVGDQGGTFVQHKQHYAFSKATLATPLQSLPFNLALFSAFQAEGLVNNVLSHTFTLSAHFSS